MAGLAHSEGNASNTGANAAMFELEQLRTLNAGRVGAVDAACPKCGQKCRSPANRKRRVLRIWDDGNFVTYKCARCEARGFAHDQHAGGMASRPKPETRAEPDRQDRAELARYLWARSLPLAGSLTELYLLSRQCLVTSSALRFLSARDEHPPAMIARFGVDGQITGVHLTKLKSDGSAKAGGEKDKIMIGPSVGQPIVVHDNPERSELLIAEGIEDAASLALCTGWTAWAAGSAGRIAQIVDVAQQFEAIYLAVDGDHAGRQALERTRTVRTDVIPVRLALVFGAKFDANKVLIKHGRDALLAAIEWAESHARLARREIGFEAMVRASMRAEGVFRMIAGDGLNL